MVGTFDRAAKAPMPRKHYVRDSAQLRLNLKLLAISPKPKLSALSLSNVPRQIFVDQHNSNSRPWSKEKKNLPDGLYMVDNISCLHLQMLITPVYDLPQDILKTLTRKDDTNVGSSHSHIENTPEEKPRIELKVDNAVGSKSCSLCGVAFYTVEDQRSHVRSDLHTYNLKQRLRGANPVSEGDFESLVGDLDESLSGSDSSDSEDDEKGDAHKETTLSALLKKQAALSSPNTDVHSSENPPPKNPKRGSGKAPLYWFATPTLPSNTYLGIYRGIFTVAEQEKEDAILDTLQNKQLSPKPQSKVAIDSNGVPVPAAYKDPHIFLCMIGGGHFAAMVVSGGVPKSFIH
jgi:hypothetical protein